MDKEFLRLIDNVDELLSSEAGKLDDEALICECFCVNAGDIRERCSGAVDLELLKRELSLGEGCQSCIKSKEAWINKIF
jgi:NAD(P)H-nitrite reductase large subunit